jgi:hypothetical protein
MTMRDRVRNAIYQLTAAAAGLMIAFALFGGRARADWTGDASPETRAWFRTVRNAVGQVCCDETEARSVDDYQWREGHVEVVIDGRSYAVAPDALSPDRNKLGAAVAWIFPKGAPVSTETIRCFLRGTEG